MEDERKEVGRRLESELRRKFKSVSAATRAMGSKDPSYFGAYIAGKTLPGKVVLSRLEKIGINVKYVMTGNEDGATSNADEKLLLVQRRVDDIKYRLDQAMSDLADVTQLINATAIKKRQSLANPQD
jgi:hypothetical protein